MRKSQLVADAILARIRSGEWGAGTRLPSERELAAEHGVSRPAVREALQGLQLSGRIETRLGDGSFVCSGDDDGAGLLAGMSISEALEAREAVELSSALLAIRRATRSDRLKLEAAVAEMEEHLEHQD
ncbi:MAG: FadR family transcriptional regulator [Nonomuraea sp.]|nr:FadR family transcriptional regulator [Nonomuraea sp.]